MEIAREIAGSVGAKPVITIMAMDVEQVFAVDVFAADDRLRIGNRTTAKNFGGAFGWEMCRVLCGISVAGHIPGSSQALREQIRIRSICKSGKVLESGSAGKEACPAGILQLIPQNLAVGIGCRRGNGGSGDRKRDAGDPGGAWMPDGTDHCDRQYPFKAGRAGTDRAGGKAACPVSLLFCGGTDEDRGRWEESSAIRTVGDRGGQCLSGRREPARRMESRCLERIAGKA